MKPAMRGVSAVLAVVGLLNWGYALFRTLNGAELSDSILLFIGGLVCFTIIALLGVSSSRQKNDEQS